MINESVRERFKRAVGILVDEKCAIKERLLVAYVSQLSTIDAEHELPDHLVDDFNRMKVVLTEDEVVGDRGNARRELDRISDDDASYFARRIYEMFLELHGRQPSAVRPGAARG